MGEETIRWTIEVDKEIDQDLRARLAELGSSEGDLAQFVEKAVRWRLFNLTLAEAREGFKDMPVDTFEALMDEAIAEVRK